MPGGYVKDPVTGKWTVGTSEAAHRTQPRAHAVDASAAAVPQVGAASASAPLFDGSTGHTSALKQELIEALTAHLTETLTAQLTKTLTTQLTAVLMEKLTDTITCKLQAAQAQAPAQAQSEQGEALGVTRDGCGDRDGNISGNDNDNDNDNGGGDGDGDGDGGQAAWAGDAEPMSYPAALQASGGEAALEEFADTSRQLCSTVGDAKLEAEVRRLLPRDYTRRKGFSTKLINQRFVRNLDDLYASAGAVHRPFARVIRALAQQTRGKALVAPLKSRTRARMKGLFKYRDASGDGVAWYRLTDIVRATLAFPGIDSMYNGLEAVLGCSEFTVSELNDRFQHPMPGGYRDIQLVVRFRDHMCELQLSTGPMLQAKETTGHRDFEVVRELKAAVAEGNLERVDEALNFGRFHLGSEHRSSHRDSDLKAGDAALRHLLQEPEAKTLAHDAAARGHANVLHALLLHGASAHAQDEQGETPLHHAVFGGHERCVWVLLDVGAPDLVERQRLLDIENAKKQTPLVKAYLMLWQRPPESAVRAVSTLVQAAGTDRVAAARDVVDDQVKSQLKPSRALVDLAADGDIDKMRDALTNYADPSSKSENGKTALEAAAAAGEVRAVEMLLDFEARLEGGKNRRSVLQLPIEANQVDTTQLLIDAGAPLEVDDGDVPLMQLAVNANSHDAAQLLASNSAPCSGVLPAMNPSRCGVDGEEKWRGVTVIDTKGGPKAFCAPHRAPSFLVIDVATGDAEPVSCGVEGDRKWCGIVAVGTKLFCAPWNASSVLVIDTGTDEYETHTIRLPFEQLPPGTDSLKNKFSGIAAVGNKIFCAPHHASFVLVIDAETELMRTLPVGNIVGDAFSNKKWAGITAVGTKLYCAPAHAPCVLVIDAETEALHSIPCGVEGEFKFYGIAAVGNKLFCAPCHSEFVLVIDTDTEAVHTIACLVDGAAKWEGITAVGNTLFCAPHNASSVLAISAETETVSLLPAFENGDTIRWCGIASSGSKAVLAPCNASDVLVLEDRLSIWNLSTPKLVRRASTGDARGILALLRSGSDVNAKDRDGRSALEAAAAKGQVAAVELLLQKGASLESGGGRSVLRGAVMANQLETTKLLITAGAPLDVGGGHTSLLQLAVDRHCRKVAEALVNAGLPSPNESVSNVLRSWGFPDVPVLSVTPSRARSRSRSRDRSRDRSRSRSWSRSPSRSPTRNQ